MNMGGMDMGMGAAGSPAAPIDNQYIAKTMWIVFAVLLGVFGSSHWLHVASNKQSKATGIMSTFKGLQAVAREITYPQIPVQFGKYSLGSVNAGRTYILAIYFSIILAFLFYKSVVTGAYYYEAIAYRAAWVSLAQVPLMLLFATKSTYSPVTMITRISYERFNWLHRWIARVLLVSVAIHGGHFLWEWKIYNYMSTELAMMPMVKWGLSAFGILGAVNIVSLRFFRRKAYELFYLGHMAFAGAFLAVVWIHIPSYARPYWFFAVAVSVFDRVLRFGTYIWNGKCKISNLQQTDDVVSFNIKTSRKWTPGQHVFLNIPRLGFLQSHPFTIASVADGENINSMRFVLRSHNGFTKSLNQASGEFSALMHGPYGGVSLEASSIVLIAGGSGASFTTPLLLEAVRENACKRIHFIWVVRNESNVEWFASNIRTIAAQVCAGTAPNVSISVYVTRQSEKKNSDIENMSMEGIKMRSGRPDLFALVNKELERALGETSVAVCGPASLSNDVRNIVASLSDARGAHKGTGAHGVHLHVESFNY